MDISRRAYTRLLDGQEWRVEGLAAAGFGVWIYPRRRRWLGPTWLFLFSLLPLDHPFFDDRLHDRPIIYHVHRTPPKKHRRK